MRIDFYISQNEGGKFHTACEALINNVGRGTKSATVKACLDIVSDALDEVPKDTGTLAASIFAGVYRRSDVKGYSYGALIGAGMPGGGGGFSGITGVTYTKIAAGKSILAGAEKGTSAEGIEWIYPPNNGVNPKNGLSASTYAATVHEDLDMPHPNGGKAKFIEDPVRNYASDRFVQTAMRYWKSAISHSSFSNPSLSDDFRAANKARLRDSAGRSTLDPEPFWIYGRSSWQTFGVTSQATQRGGQRIWKGREG